jgi:hypothetical protein
MDDMTQSIGTKAAERIDLELRRICWTGNDYQYEFQAMNSFGQEFVMDVLGLRGCGELRMKLVVTGWAQKRGIVKQAEAEGLRIQVVGDGVSL